MYSLVYRSEASELFSLPEIYKMLSNARDYNAEHDITGCLLYHNAQFLQLLEGEEEEVRLLFEKIKSDSRHHHVITICEDTAKDRMFSEWSMAFHDYGLNGTSSQLKLKQIDDFFEKSSAYIKPNTVVLPFFTNVKKILFEK